MPNAQEFEQAKQALKAAESRFNYATGPYVDAAVLELSAAKLRLSAVIQQMRSCPQGCSIPQQTRAHNPDTPRLKDAYSAARRARFEHGESGWR